MKWLQRLVACLALLGFGVLYVMVMDGFFDRPRDLSTLIARPVPEGVKRSRYTASRFDAAEHKHGTSKHKPGIKKSSPPAALAGTMLVPSHTPKEEPPNGPKMTTGLLNKPAQETKEHLEQSPQKKPNDTKATSNKVGIQTANRENPQQLVSHTGSSPDKVENKNLGQSQTSKMSPTQKYPPEWINWWRRSEAFPYHGQKAGDQGLFPPCKDPVTRTYGFVEPQNYVANSKNPCFYENFNAKKGLRCLPYFYVVGGPESGATDLYKRTRFHPDIRSSGQKDFHWWERTRFGEYDVNDPEGTINVNKPGEVKFKEYLTSIMGEEGKTIGKELLHFNYSKCILGDYTLSYFWDPQHWYALDGNQGCKEPRIIVAQHIYHVFPGAMVLVMLRNPTPRMYASYTSRFANVKNSTRISFHNDVVASVRAYTECFRIYSLRRCAYNGTLFRNMPVRLVEGMYSVFMSDWLRVWPRKQLLLIRYEDYQGHEEQHVKDVFTFLGLDRVNDMQMTKMSLAIERAGPQKKNTEDMLHDTKKVLDNFYQPFNHMLRDVLKDDRFLWKELPAI